MAVVKEGWIEKCGPVWSPTWHKRWLVLYETRVMEYFSSETKKDLKGMIELIGAESVKPSDTDPGKLFKYGFCLTTKGRAYRFAADSETDRGEWCEKLQKAIAGTLPKRRKTTRVGSGHQRSATFGSKPLLSPDNSLIRVQSLNTDSTLPILDSEEVKEQEQVEEKKTIKEVLKKRSELEMVGSAQWSKIMECLITLDIATLFITSKYLRGECLKALNNDAFFQFYSFKIFPLKTLRRYSRSRQPRFPWVFAHDYKQIWVFGTCPEFKYSTLTLPELEVERVKRLDLDDFLLWDPDDNEMEEMLLFIRSRTKQIEDLHLRSYTDNPKWIKQLSKFTEVVSLSLSMKFQRYLCEQLVIPENILHLALLRVDLVPDEAESSYLGALFLRFRKLLVLQLEESRWKGTIYVPPQVKFFRYVPSDYSVVNLQRIVVDEENSHDLPYDLNYALDLIVSHKNWPAVLNGSLQSGHEALKGHRLRVWILHNKREWDKQVMNVNYCTKPPLLKLFQANNCFKDLTHLDNIADMTPFWDTENETKIP